jgi:hypothetical protein
MNAVMFLCINCKILNSKFIFCNTSFSFLVVLSLVLLEFDISAMTQHSALLCSLRVRIDFGMEPMNAWRKRF